MAEKATPRDFLWCVRLVQERTRASSHSAHRDQRRATRLRLEGQQRFGVTLVIAARAVLPYLSRGGVTPVWQNEGCNGRYIERHHDLWFASQRVVQRRARAHAA